jgi:hypothetical protein
LPLAAATNQLTLQAFNRRGEIVGTDSMMVTTTGAEDSQRAFLRVTELLYHPADPSAAEAAAGFNNSDEFEYVELANLGPSALALSGVRFTQGIEFDFTGAAIQTLASGARVLLVKNREAIELRFGTALPIAGTFAGSLNNSGETLQLVDRLGLVIQEFTYNDTPPWPESADGIGSSLEVVDPNGDYSNATNWQASDGVGGSPGTAAVVRPAFSQIVAQDGRVRFQFTARAGLSYQLLSRDEVATGDWQVLELVPAGAAREVEVLDTSPLAERRFYRLATP